jgi:hypothetical protein
MGPYADVGDLISRKVIEKYEGLLERFGAPTKDCMDDLRLANRVRNDIVHYLPTMRSAGEPVPPDISELDRRGLMVRWKSDPPGDFSYGQKLCSYRLAVWCMATVEAAAGFLHNAAPDEIRWAVNVHNFRLYRERDHT